MCRALRASGQTPPQTPAAASPASTPRQRPPASPRAQAAGRSLSSTPRSAEYSTLSPRPAGSLGRVNASPPPGAGRPPLSPRVGHPQAKERQPAGASGRKPRKSLIAAAAEIALSGSLNSDDDDSPGRARDRDRSGTPDFVLRTNPHRTQPLPSTPRNSAYRLSPRAGQLCSDEDAQQTASKRRGCQQTQEKTPVDLIEIPCIPFSTASGAGGVAASPVPIPRIPLHLLNENEGGCEGGGGSGEPDPLPLTPGNGGVAGKGRSGSSKRAGTGGGGGRGSLDASRAPPASPRRSSVQQSALLFALEVAPSVMHM